MYIDFINPPTESHYEFKKMYEEEVNRLRIKYHRRSFLLQVVIPALCFPTVLVFIALHVFLQTPILLAYLPLLILLPVSIVCAKHEVLKDENLAIMDAYDLVKKRTGKAFALDTIDMVREYECSINNYLSSRLSGTYKEHITISTEYRSAGNLTLALEYTQGDVIKYRTLELKNVQLERRINASKYTYDITERKLIIPWRGEK